MSPDNDDVIDTACRLAACDLTEMLEWAVGQANAMTEAEVDRVRLEVLARLADVAPDWMAGLVDADDPLEMLWAETSSPR